MNKVSKRRRRRTVPLLLLLMVIVIGILFFDSNTRLVVTEYELSYSNLPAAFDGYRIAALSDIHAAVFGVENDILISRVQSAKPDIIAITGDLIDADDQLEIVETLITGLTAIAPVYYITGNHEWDSGGIRPLLEKLPELGVTVLRNSYVKLAAGGSEIVLAGTDDPNGPADMIKPVDFVEKIYNAEGSPFIVMLEHRNNHLGLYSSLGVDLVICGHAHGGIIRLPFTDGLVGPSREWLPTFTNGIYEQGNTKMLVSRGIGNHTGYPRFLNNPHIAVAVLKAG